MKRFSKLTRNGHIATILTFIGAFGVVVTAVQAVKSSKSAGDAKTQVQSEKGEEPLTITESVMAQAPAYAPAIISGATTIACMFVANVLNKKQQAALISAYTALESQFLVYRKSINKLCGAGTDSFLQEALQRQKQAEEDEPPWDRVITFYIQDMSKPQFFERTTEEVMQAVYHLNRNFILRGYATFNEFLSFLHLDPVEDGNVGWDTYDGEVYYGYRWIDVNRRWVKTEDGLRVCCIDLPFGPHTIYGEIP